MAEQSNLSKIFGTIGHTAQSIASDGFGGGDLTPGYSIRNVVSTQAGNIFGGNKPAPIDTTTTDDGSTYQQELADSVNKLRAGAGTNSTFTGTGGGAAQYDQAISQYSSLLNNLQNQLGIAQGNVNTQYGQKSNELQSAFDQAKANYGQNTGQNQQQYRSNKNQIQDTASAGLRGLLRTLGAYGAGGSSDALYTAPGAVATQAAQQRAGAGDTFGQNQQNLDTTWNQYAAGADNQKRQLEDWRTGQLNQAQQSSLSNKQSILQKLADLRAQRAGGNTAEATAAMNEANGLQGRIDQLGAFNPTYTGTTPTYTAPSIASYNVDPNATTQVADATADGTPGSYLQMLLGNKKNSKQPAFA
jgi:hypothetical protein